jgi:hypothetical protein
MAIHDAELLSAYLDGQLGRSESAQLEAKLASDASLRRLLDDLRLARGLARKVPRRRVPRNFTLTAKTPRLNPPEPRSVPVLRFASILASFLFLAGIALNTLAPAVSRSMPAAPAPMFAAGAAESAPSAATQAPLQAVGGAAPTEIAGARQSLTPQDLVRATSAAAPGAAPQAIPPLAATSEAAPEAASKAAPPAAAGEAVAARPQALPMPLAWEVVLGGVGLLFAWLAWYVRRSSESSFRRRWMKK